MHKIYFLKMNHKMITQMFCWNGILIPKMMTRDLMTTNGGRQTQIKADQEDVASAWDSDEVEARAVLLFDLYLPIAAWSG